MGMMRGSALAVLLAFLSCAYARDNCKMKYGSTTMKCTNVTDFGSPRDPMLTFGDDVHGFLGVLKELEIVDTNITVLTRHMFKVTPRLSRLILSNVSLQRIDHGAFSGLSKLKWIDLSHNRIEKLSTDIFVGTRLMHLDLEGNHLEIPTNGPIFNAKYLTGLTLKNCSIRHLSGSSFVANPMLSNLDLSYNQLEMLPTQIFRTLYQLSYIDLSHNNFKVLDMPVFKAIPLLPTSSCKINLANNPWSSGDDWGVATIWGPEDSACESGKDCATKKTKVIRRSS